MRYACALTLLTTLAVTVGCKNTVTGQPDAGTIGAEGEGEGDVGEGEVGEGEGDCSTAVPVFGMVVIAKDSVTDFPLCDATASINEGAFSETLAPRGVSPDCDYAGALDRAGTYDIQVTHPDYPTPAGLVDIAVSLDECNHAILRRVVLELAPE